MVCALSLSGVVRKMLLKSGRRQNGANQKGKLSIIIAKEQGVGQTTVERAEEFKKGVDAAEEVSPGFKEKVLSGANDKCKGFYLQKGDKHKSPAGSIKYRFLLSPFLACFL